MTFSVSAPSASRVELSGQFMDGTCPMRKGTDGVWSVTVKIAVPTFILTHSASTGWRFPTRATPWPSQRRFKASLLEMPDTAASMHAIKMFRGDRYAIAVIIPRSCRPTVRCWCIPLRGYDREAGRRYPVLYLVSGTTDTEETWYKVGRVDAILDNLIAGRAEPMLVVMPYGYMPSHGTPMPHRLRLPKCMPPLPAN